MQKTPDSEGEISVKQQLFYRQEAYQSYRQDAHKSHRQDAHKYRQDAHQKPRAQHTQHHN